MADQELIGLRQIGQFLGCSPATVERLRVEYGLLVYKKNLRRVIPGGRRWAWVSTPSLITAWRIARCKADRDANLSGDQTKTVRPGVRR